MTTEHPDSTEKPITFVLIHGTFAPRAGWTLDGSALTSSLAEAALSCGAKASFKKVLWTGKNRLTDRYRASEQLDLIVSNAAENERFIIVGHSHGGSVVAYFLKRKASMPPNVLGCVFLSTPFLALRERAGLILFGQARDIVLWVAWLTLLQPLFENTEVKDLIYGFAFATVFMIVWKLAQHSKQPISGRITAQQTADLPNGNYLFLRSTGDEAAAALSFAQFSLWLSTQLSRPFFSRLTANLFLNVRTGNPSLWKTSLVQIVIVICIAAPIRYYDLIKQVLFADHQRFEAADWTFMALASLVLLIPSVVAIVFALASVLGVAWIAIQAVVARSFGLSRFIDGIVFELSVEPLPFGEHCLHHIPWHATPGLPRLAHSWTYEDATALSAVQRWVCRTMQAVQ